MQPRVFGKELLNLQQSNKPSYSHIHAGKSRDHKAQLQAKEQRTQMHKSIQTSNKHSTTLIERPQPHCKNTQLVPEYFSQNLHYLKKQEKTTYKLSNYVALHKTISEKERGKLVDWLSRLHYRFKMSPETLFTVVSYVDQYLQVRSPALPELQLLGVAALLVGSKIEETYQVPPLKQLISCCAYQYTASQILAKEDQILTVLDFSLIVNSSFTFFGPFSSSIGLEVKNHHLAHYILSLALLQPKFLNYLPSLLAASVIYLVKKIRKSQAIWDAQMTAMVEYQEKELKNCAKELCCLLESAPDIENGQSIKDKFSQSCFHEVTRIKLERREKK